MTADNGTKASKAGGRTATAAAAAPAGPAAAGPAGGAKDRAPRGPGRPSKTDRRRERTERLANQLASVSVGLLLISPADAQAVGRHAQGIAEALAELAEQNAVVAKLLDGAATGGAWLGLLGAVVPLLLDIAGNHGLLPEGIAQLLGHAPPEPAPTPRAPQVVTPA